MRFLKSKSTMIVATILAVAGAQTIVSAQQFDDEPFDSPPHHDGPAKANHDFNDADPEKGGGMQFNKTTLINGAIVGLGIGVAGAAAYGVVRHATKVAAMGALGAFGAHCWETFGDDLVRGGLTSPIVNISTDHTARPHIVTLRETRHNNEEPDMSPPRFSDDDDGHGDNRPRPVYKRPHQEIRERGQPRE